MKTISHILIFTSTILCIFGMFYLAYTKAIEMNDIKNLLLYFIKDRNCMNDDSKCSSSDICVNDKCINSCYNRKCGLNEYCLVLYHEYECDCIPKFIRNVTTNICDIKVCANNDDCGRDEQCNKNYSTCECMTNFIWDWDSSLCLRKDAIRKNS